MEGVSQQESRDRGSEIKGKTNANGEMMLQRFRGKTNRYSCTHNTPTQQLNNAATLSFHLPPWPLSSLCTVQKSLFLFCTNCIFFRHTFSKCIYKTASVCNLSIKKLFLFASNSLEGHVLQFVGSNADQHFQCVCFA